MNPNIESISLEFQTEGSPSQVKFSSIIQRLLHPSPSIILASSHSSEPKIVPSPQIGDQLEGKVSVQLHPASTEQVLSQPSPSEPLESSHSSNPSCDPFPQIRFHLLGL